MAVAVAVSIGAGSRVAAVDGETRRPAVIEEFKVAKEGRLLTVPVSIGGRTFPFLLDTGCNLLVFDETLRPLLGEKRGEIVTNIVGGQARLQLFEAPPCRLGKLPLPRVNAACIDLRSLSETSGAGFYGIIGFNCLVDHVLRIDFDKGLVTFLRSPAETGAQQTPLEWTRNGEFLDGVYVVADLAGIGKVKFLIDTGTCGFRSVALAKPLFDKALASARAAQLRTDDDVAISLAGHLSSRIARIERLSLGPFTHQGLLTDDLGPSRLGLAYLSRYVATFDFPRKVLYLRAGRQFARADLHGASGLKLVPIEDDIMVGDVSKGGAAERAGIRFGDQIIELDDIRASGSTVFDLCRALAEPGRHRVVFLRFIERHETLLDVAAPSAHSDAARRVDDAALPSR